MFNKKFLLINSGSGNLVANNIDFEQLSRHIDQAGKLYQKVLYQAIDQGNAPFFELGTAFLDCRHVLGILVVAEPRMAIDVVLALRTGGIVPALQVHCGSLDVFVQDTKGYRQQGSLPIDREAFLRSG